MFVRNAVAKTALAILISLLQSKSEIRKEICEFLRHDGRQNLPNALRVTLRRSVFAAEMLGDLSEFVGARDDNRS